jgi:hypothetical protein
LKTTTTARPLLLPWIAIAIAIVFPWLLLPCLLLPCIGRDGRDWRLLLLWLLCYCYCHDCHGLLAMDCLPWIDVIDMMRGVCEGYFGQSNDVEAKWLHQLRTNSKLVECPCLYKFLPGYRRTHPKTNLGFCHLSLLAPPP